MSLELSLDFTRIEHENGDYLRPPAETANSTQMERALPSPNIVYPLVKHNGRRFSYSMLLSFTYFFRYYRVFIMIY